MEFLNMSVIVYPRCLWVIRPPRRGGNVLIQPDPGVRKTRSPLAKLRPLLRSSVDGRALCIVERINVRHRFDLSNLQVTTFDLRLTFFTPLPLFGYSCDLKF